MKIITQITYNHHHLLLHNRGFECNPNIIRYIQISISSLIRSTTTTKKALRTNYTTREKKNTTEWMKNQKDRNTARGDRYKSNADVRLHKLNSLFTNKPV